VRAGSAGRRSAWRSYSRVAEPIGGEDFAPPAPSLRVDLDHFESLRLVSADVEPPAGQRARRPRHAAQREPVAEGSQRLVAQRRISSAQQRA
jgi:hypothetical protein